MYLIYVKLDRCALIVKVVQARACCEFDTH